MGHCSVNDLLEIQSYSHQIIKIALPSCKITGIERMYMCNGANTNNLLQKRRQEEHHSLFYTLLKAIEIYSLS